METGQQSLIMDKFVFGEKKKLQETGSDPSIVIVLNRIFVYLIKWERESP